MMASTSSHFNFARPIPPSLPPPPPPPPPPLSACRFCLRADVSMRPLPIKLLPQTDIPQLFETVAAIKLDLSPGYSELLCTECEQRMRTAAQTRVDFLLIVQQWQVILHGMQPNVKTEQLDDAAAAETRAFLECELGGEADAVKQEDGLAVDEDEDDGDNNDNNDRRERKRRRRERRVHKTEYDYDYEQNDAASDYDDDYDDDDDDDEDDGEDSAADRAASTSSGRNTSTGYKKKEKRRKSAAEKPKKPRKKYEPGLAKFGRPLRGTPLICDICGAQLSTKHILRMHMRNKHHPKPTVGHTASGRFDNKATGGTCPICGKTNLKSMVHHMRDHRRADQYKCAHCPRTFCRADMRLQHERMHTGERPFICEVCGFSFTSAAGLKQHTQLRHNGDAAEQQLQRPQRPQIVRTQPTGTIGTAAVPVLKRLPPAVHAAGRLQCPMCEQTYANRPSLYIHVKIQHGAAGRIEWKRYLATVCAVCAERFETAEALVEHRQREHQPFMCEICRRRFASRLTLELHVQKHSKKERRYKCEICEALYPCSFTLRIHHRRAHTDERPYRCAQCPLGFVEQWSLRAHVKKQHTFMKGLRPHQCTECTETFKTGDALRAHMEKHTGQYRYQCKVCQRNQHTGPQLVQHMQSYHMEIWRAEEAELERLAQARANGGQVGGTIATATTTMMTTMTTTTMTMASGVVGGLLKYE